MTVPLKQSQAISAFSFLYHLLQIPAAPVLPLPYNFHLLQGKILLRILTYDKYPSLRHSTDSLQIHNAFPESGPTIEGFLSFFSHSPEPWHGFCLHTYSYPPV